MVGVRAWSGCGGVVGIPCIPCIPVCRCWNTPWDDPWDAVGCLTSMVWPVGLTSDCPVSRFIVCGWNDAVWSARPHAHRHPGIAADRDLALDEWGRAESLVADLAARNDSQWHRLLERDRRLGRYQIMAGVSLIVWLVTVAILL
jgi:hypothetical protein